MIRLEHVGMNSVIRLELKNRDGREKEAGTTSEAKRRLDLRVFLKMLSNL